MITLIISGLCFVGLVALCLFIPLQNNKTLIMAGIVMLMLLVTIVDELIIPKYPLSKVQSAQHFQQKPLQSNLKLNISTELYKNTPARTLLKQQRTLLTYLVDKQNNKQNILLYVKNIDNSRFRAVFREFQAQTSAPAVYVDFDHYDYTFLDLESALADGKVNYKKHSNQIVYFIVGNLGDYSHFAALENLFLTYNVSYIFQSLPMNLFELSTLSKWTHQYEFQGNYISQVLQNHPPRLVQICNKYRTIDYAFYVMSQTEPLSQLCTKLPSNAVTECIRAYMEKAEDRVPFAKVRKCFEGSQIQDVEGVRYENGLVGLKKDYFYAGRVDKSLFTIDQTHQNENL